MVSARNETDLREEEKWNCDDSLAIIKGVRADGDEGQVAGRVREGGTRPREAQHVLRGENIK